MAFVNRRLLCLVQRNCRQQLAMSTAILSRRLIVPTVHYGVDQTRYLSSQSKIKTIKIPELPPLGPNIIFTPIPNATTDKLVLLFAWMKAKDSHLDKYRHFWHNRGYDVLSVVTRPKDLMDPQTGAQRNSLAVQRFLLEHSYHNVVMHSFSVGAYASYDFLYYMHYFAQTDPKVDHKLRTIRGQVMDSLTWFNDAPRGMAMTYTDNPILQGGITFWIWLYFIINYFSVVQTFTTVESLLKQNKLPSLMFYSRNDAVSNPKYIDELVEDWLNLNGTKVHAKCWPDSTHVLHYKENQAEYTQWVDRFLNGLKMDKYKLSK